MFESKTICDVDCAVSGIVTAKNVILRVAWRFEAVSERNPQEPTVVGGLH